MIPEYSPYTLPYRTTPQLYKWETDFGNGEMDKRIFQKDDNFERYHKEQLAGTHKGFGYNPKYEDELEIIWDFIAKEVNEKRELGAFWLQDDYVVVRVKDTDEIICHSSFLPSLWRPEGSLGKSLLTLHEPVPKLTLPKKVLESCVKSRFVRFVWSIFHSDRLNQHPDLPLESFNPENPNWHIRVERQSIIPFPDISCFLFVIKPYIVRHPKIPELFTTIRGMSQEFKDYKRITPEFEKYLNSL